MQNCHVEMKEEISIMLSNGWYFSVVLFFYFLIFLVLLFRPCRLCQRLGPANILLFLQLSLIYDHILQDICLFEKGDINKMVIQTIVHLRRTISSNTLWHLATKQKGKQGDFLNQFFHRKAPAKGKNVWSGHCFCREGLGSFFIVYHLPG